MWTSIIDLSPRKVILTSLLGRFWRGAYFSSFAPLQVQNVPRQSLPGAKWVRVRNRLAGICGSDLHLIHADGDLRVAPAALPGHAQAFLGHEVVGEVIEIGDEVQRLQVGDRVVLQHSKNCVSADMESPCFACANGDFDLCEHSTLPGPDPIGGGWSEEMLLHEQQLFRVPPDMSDTQAVMLEPSAVSVHAVLRRVPQAGERVLIIGAGTIGLLTLQTVRALSPQAEISVLARYPFQIEKATRMGAAHIIYPQDSYSGVQQATQAQLYKGIWGNQMLLGGYDVIYDTVGTQKTIHNSLRWTRAKGTVVLVGLSLHMMRIDLTPVWFQEVNLVGTMGQGMEKWPIDSSEQRSTFAVTADLITHGLLKPEQLITHHFALNNYRQALLTAMDKRDQRTIKVVFDYSLLPASVVPNVRASARQRQRITTNIHLTPPDTTEEELLQPAPAMFSTERGATWEKQALPRVSQTLATKTEAPLVDAQTQAREQISLDTQQDLDATQKVRIVEIEQQQEATAAMPALEHPVTADNSLQTMPPDENEAMNPTNAAGEIEATTTQQQSINDETTEAVPSIHEETTQAVPSAREQATHSEQKPSDEIPLDELEWLDILAAEEAQQEPAGTVTELSDNAPSSLSDNALPVVPQLPGQQEPQVGAAIPVVIPSDAHIAQSDPQNLTGQTARDEAWVAEEAAFYTFVNAPYEENDAPVLEDLQYEKEPQPDFVTDDFDDVDQETQLEDYEMDGEHVEVTHEKEVTTNPGSETLFVTKTSKALNPSKLGSKNRRKGKNNSGSYR